MLRMQQTGAQNRQIAQAIEIHRFLRNPWIPAQSMDPQIAQRDPWIAQIHRLRPTYMVNYHETSSIGVLRRSPPN